MNQLISKLKKIYDQIIVDLYFIAVISGLI